MLEINLLRWQQKAVWFTLQKKFIILIIALICISLTAHIFISHINLKLEQQLTELKNTILTPQSNSADTFHETMTQIQMTQKKLWHLIDLLSCLKQSQIQIDKMTFQKQQIYIVGMIKAATILSVALQNCQIKNQFVIKKMSLLHKGNSDLLKFSLVMV